MSKAKRNIFSKFTNRQLMKKEQERRFYTVREKKTGRVFEAEYDSESAAFYEKGTGKEYHFADIAVETYIW